MTKQFKIEFTFGTEVDADGRPLDRLGELDAYLKAIETTMAQVYGAYTVVETRGGWTNGEGKLVEEKGRMMFTVQPEIKEAELVYMSSYIRMALQQEAVCVTVTEVIFGFNTKTHLPKLP